MRLLADSTSSDRAAEKEKDLQAGKDPAGRRSEPKDNQQTSIFSSGEAGGSVESGPAAFIGAAWTFPHVFRCCSAGAAATSWLLRPFCRRSSEAFPCLLTGAEAETQPSDPETEGCCVTVYNISTFLRKRRGAMVTHVLIRLSGGQKVAASVPAQRVSILKVC